MKVKVKLEYAQPHSNITNEQRLVLLIVADRSLPRKTEMEHMLMTSSYFNECVEWLHSSGLR